MAETNYGKQGFQNAYIGDDGVSLSNQFLVDNTGHLYSRVAYFGGGYNPNDAKIYTAPTINRTDKVEDEKEKTATTIQPPKNGWSIYKGSIYTEHQLVPNKDDYRIIHLRGYHTNGEAVFCVGATRKNDYSRATFRIRKQGDILCTDPKSKKDSNDAYGSLMLQLRSYNDFDTIDDNSKITLKTSFYPNSIYMENTIYNKRTADGTIDIADGRITFIPGSLYDDTHKQQAAFQGNGNGGHFYFNRPLTTSGYRITTEGIPAIGYTATSSGWYPNTRYLSFGATRDDILNKDKRYSKPPSASIVRGKDIIFNAYGSDENTSSYGGMILMRANSIYVPNNIALWGGITGQGTMSNKPTRDRYKRMIGVAATVDDKYSCSGNGKRNSRLVIGSATNPGHVEVRSKESILLKCGGLLTDGRDYSSKALQFAALNFGTATKEKIRGCLRPLLNNSVRLGSPSYRWHKIYLSNSPSVSSDRRLKCNIETLLNDTRYLTFFDYLKPSRFKWLDKEQQGFNLGFIAQEVEEALTLSGLSVDDFAALEKDENGFYSLGYEDFIALAAAKIQSLELQIKKYDNLETELNMIKQYLQLA